MSRKLHLLVFSLLVFMATLGTLVGQSSSDPAWKSQKAGDFELQWRIVADTIELSLSGPNTGWMAVGFNPSSMMKDADYVIGFVKDGKAEARDDYGFAATAHRPDADLGGTNNVRVISGSEANGRTTFVVSRPLNSGDKNDFVYASGKSVKVIWAFAGNNADNYMSPHVRRGSFTITL